MSQIHGLTATIKVINDHNLAFQRQVVLSASSSESSFMSRSFASRDACSQLQYPSGSFKVHLRLTFSILVFFLRSAVPIQHHPILARKTLKFYSLTSSKGSLLSTCFSQTISLKEFRI